MHEQLLAAEAARGTLVLDVQNVAGEDSPLDPAPELLFETLLLFLVGILLLVGLLTAAATPSLPPSPLGSA